MINCAECNGILCSEDDILDRIDRGIDDEDCINGGYYFDIKCNKCDRTNNVFVKTKMKISHVETGIMLWG